MIFYHVNVGSAQWPLLLAEGFLPTTIKSHMVKIVITWSISPDENNNIGLVYTDTAQCSLAVYFFCLFDLILYVPSTIFQL